MVRKMFRCRFGTVAVGTTMLIAMLIAPRPSNGQSAGQLLKGLLPSPGSSVQTELPPATPQEVIPLAQPADAGEIVVEEQGQGLISLKVRDASLKQVVSMIAETQRVNVVFATSDDIRISGSLVRVPWQQALQTVIASAGHTWTDDQGILVVTSLDAAEGVSPRANGRRVETFELDFAKAIDVEQTVQGLLSPVGQAWVSQSSVTDNRQSREVVAVYDFPDHLAQVADYICQIDQPPRQVLIKANILQVDLRDDCRSGVNLQQLVSFSGNQIEFSTVGLANPTASTATFLELTGGSLDGLIELLKTTTDAKSLASTEILAVSGQEARLQSGQQLGFRVTTTTQTSTLESVEFIDVGVVLTVTPQVTRDGRVLMRIKPEVSEGQVDPETGLPAEDTVEVETDVLLNNGQGLVIGGLIQEIDSNVQSKVPLLGDIPYAGILFQRRQLIKSRAEIIVTLIPHVMPYTPIEIEHNDQRLMRTQQPLLSPPLQRFPRPYEPQLLDTFTNPRPLCVGRRCRTAPVVSGGSVPITPTPNQLVPQPADGQGPLCYPPAGSGAPSAVPQQATRPYPFYR
ncbi:MAG: hypothetical protein AAGD11_09675 [Planctomycetota bacterium]